MKNNLQRPYLPHNQHLYPIQQRPLLRQKSITGTVTQTEPKNIKTQLLPIQNLEIIRKDFPKVKIKFNYNPSTPSTPKFGEEENLSVKTGNSSPRTNLSPQKSMSDLVQNSSTGAVLEVVQPKQSPTVNETLQFSKPIQRQHKLNLQLVQKRKEVKSKTLNYKYQVIAEVLPTLEVSRHQRDEEMITLKRELNETRSQNNQLRTEVLRYEKKLEQIEENHRNKTEKLVQEIKELRIELQKAQNDKLLAQVSEAELQKKIKKMMEDNAQREKLQKVREDYLFSPFQCKKQRVYQNNITHQPYIQLFVNQPQ